MAKNISNIKKNVVLKGTSGNDTINNHSELADSERDFAGSARNVTIYAGKGNDIITNDGSDYPGSMNVGAKNARIYAEAGNDTINNDSANNATISGGAGNDLISNDWSNYVSINGGAGNDLISLGSYATNTVIKFAEGDGVDTITGFDSDDTLKITSGNYMMSESGNDLIVTIGENSITLKDALIGGYERIHIQNSFGKSITYNDWEIWSGSIEDNIYDGVTLAGSDSADTIGNSAEEVLITGQAGNDTIYNSGNYSIIRGGADNDLISLSSDSYNAINTEIQYAKGDGNDTIIGFNDDDTLNITSGKYTVDTVDNNFIVTVGENTVVLKLENCSEKINIKDSSGEVKVYNDDWTVWNGSIQNNIKSNVTLAGSKKADTIGNQAADVLITGQAGNDSIYNQGGNVTISGGAGNDTIIDDGESWSYGNETGKTISGDTGNDLISLGSYSYNNLIQYAAGDGNDTIVGINSDDTLQITSGDYTVDTVGNNFVVKVGENSIVFKTLSEQFNIQDSSGEVKVYNFDWKVWEGSIDNTKSKVTLAGSKNADTIGNSGANVLITGKAGNDTISNYDKNVTINAGAGNDSIYNYYGSKTLIDGGAGSDTIHSVGRNVTITGGAGNDSIKNNEYDVIIDGGAGNDTISTNGTVTITGGAGNDYISLSKSNNSINDIRYAAGDGFDTIRNFSSNDTLRITSGEYSASVSGSDVIVTVGTGSITLKDAKGKKISITDSKGDTVTKRYSANLFENNNLSEIVADKTVAEFENYKSDYKQENLITFAK